MKAIIRRAALLAACMILMLATASCGFKYNVKGQVVDARTGTPIEGASVAIKWTDIKLTQPLAPYASGRYKIEEAKDISDAEGYFTIPKYPGKDFSMGVYKKGYICWSSNRIFIDGPDIKDRAPLRGKDNKVTIKNGMTVELEPFTEGTPKLIHAQWTVGTSRHSGGLSGIEDERKIYREYRKKNKAKSMFDRD